MINSLILSAFGVNRIVFFLSSKKTSFANKEIEFFSFSPRQLLWTTKFRGLWQLLKLEMFWLNVCELFRPIRLFCNHYASLVSLDLLFAARLHIYFYHLSSWFSTVVIGLLYDNCHRKPCLSLSLLRVLSGKFCSRFFSYRS